MLWLLARSPEKPLKVEVVVDPAKLAARAPAAAAAAAATKGAAAQAGRGRPARRGRGGKTAGAKREARPKKTVEDLDAEMEGELQPCSIVAPKKNLILTLAMLLL